MNWMIDHLKRQETLIIGIQLGIISEMVAEAFDQIDNKLRQNMIHHVWSIAISIN